MLTFYVANILEISKNLNQISAWWCSAGNAYKKNVYLIGNKKSRQKRKSVIKKVGNKY